MPTLLGRYRPEIPPGMGPQFDSDDQDDYASTQSNFNGNQIASDAAVARRQMDPLNSLPPEPPRQSATAPASLQPPTPPPQRATPPPPSASANAPEPPPEIQPAEPSQWAPPSDKPVGPGNLPNETGTADKLMDDFAKEGTSRPEAPKDNIWQRIARVATTVLGADPDRQEAMLHPKYTAQRNRYDQGIQDDANAQTLREKSENLKSLEDTREQNADTRATNSQAHMLAAEQNAAAKQERAQQARATWQLAMSDKGALRQDPNKIPPPGYTLIDDPIEPGVKWAAPPAPKNQMMKLTPELAKAMNKQPGEEVPEASYLAFAQIEAKKTNEDAVLADRNYQKEQDRQARQDNLRLAASLKPGREPREPRPPTNTEIQQGVRQSANKAVSDARKWLAKNPNATDDPYDLAMSNVDKYYANDDQMQGQTEEIKAQILKYKKFPDGVVTKAGQAKASGPYSLNTGSDGKLSIVKGQGDAAAKKPASAPQQRPQQAQQAQQPQSGPPPVLASLPAGEHTIRNNKTGATQVWRKEANGNTTQIN